MRNPLTMMDFYLGLFRNSLLGKLVQFIKLTYQLILPSQRYPHIHGPLVSLSS